MAERRTQPLELADAEGRGTGRFRVFAINPDDLADRLPCCNCPEGHATCAEAEACDKLNAVGGEAPAQPAESEPAKE
jgi:hypothetical protein